MRCKLDIDIFFKRHKLIFVFYRFSGIVAQFIVRLLGVQYDIRGTENIRKENGGVVLLNHQSALDIISKSTRYLI